MISTEAIQPGVRFPLVSTSSTAAINTQATANWRTFTPPLLPPAGPAVNGKGRPDYPRPPARAALKLALYAASSLTGAVVGLVVVFVCPVPG